jgi:WD40 repeat protein
MEGIVSYEHLLPVTSVIDSPYCLKEMPQRPTAIIEQASTEKAGVFSKSSEMSLLPILQSGFSKTFKLDELNVDVTSIDISAHGCYVLVGCSNGIIILFSTAIPNHGGILVGHIHAKGLHTNLNLFVKVTEDCRFCFGGVSTGSSEILAIDMCRLPVDTGSQRREEVNSELITIYSHFDPKLRGFGNVARVCYPEGHEAAYRLICGRARLLHIWEFRPENQQQWTCMYDVSTNGNTIECIEFRNGGLEVLTKSAGANLRVWNLCQYETDPTARPSYEDIPNSTDVKSLLGDFAFGGMYNFAVVKIGAPKEANRDAFEMPERYYIYLYT